MVLFGSSYSLTQSVSEQSKTFSQVLLHTVTNRTVFQITPQYVKHCSLISCHRQRECRLQELFPFILYTTCSDIFELKLYQKKHSVHRKEGQMAF